ncbi:hypothetical protein O6H91_07G025600 [Diphasiastrum complanatum]|uniref:Uncharacterized protein n=1 Tax=Diphasiastrum complanatum TaxID=34168 RepID=A0ACC2D3E7_DIPCM|nr:hypothetical protein O6H91_07G025600 [Diphasiastrum complanatum]
MKDEEKEPVPQADDKDIDKWAIGFAPVDRHGRPLTDLSSTGGWLAALFIFGTEATERMAYYGIAANYIVFLVSKFHLTFPEASTLTVNVLGTSLLTPLIGGFIADAYLGRYKTIAIFSSVYVIGLVLLTISATIPSLLPSQEGCTRIYSYLGLCMKASTRQTAFLYFGLYVVALGSGGIKPCVSSFGADQFDVSDPSEKKNLGMFFNFFYMMVAFGIFLSLTVIVYIQTYVGWGWGMGALALGMVTALIIFLLGTPLYRHKLPSGSPLTRIAQVIVAAIRKRGVKVPEDDRLLYEVYDKESAIIGSRKLRHTRFFRFLDRAAVEAEPEVQAGATKPPSPWRLCTVTQVEEFKSLIRLMPICASSIILNAAFIHIVSYSVQQGITMDRRLFKHFVVPAASVPVFASIATIILLPFYDKLYVPLLRRFTGHPRGTTFLQRIGIGLAISATAVTMAGFVERRRRQLAYSHNLVDNPIAIIPMSAFWLVFQYFVIGMGEIFASVGQLEFFYDQAPDGLRTLGTSFFALGSGIGNFVASLLVTIVNKATGSSHGHPWLSSNINTGHLDYYYWLLAVLSVINMIIFMIIAHRYEYKVDISKGQKAPISADVGYGDGN